MRSIKTLDAKARVSFLVGSALHELLCIIAGRIKHVSAAPLGEDICKLVLGFS